MQKAVADFNSTEYPDKITFGNNMNTLTLHLSHLIPKTIGRKGDRIIITHLDQKSNVVPWILSRLSMI